MNASHPQPGQPQSRDNGSESNRDNRPAQGEQGMREDEAREPGSRIEGPGFGKGSNAV